MTLNKIAFILNAKHIGTNVVIKTITIHSQVITKQCMFIALIGKRFDGHDFSEQAVISGAQALLVTRHLLLSIPQLIVVDTHTALIQLATWIRRQVSSKVISITGSSGKTSVKEMTTSILQNCGKIVSTKDNFNNLIGVSLTVLNLTKKDNFAIIELGSNHTGEIYKLSKIVLANVALVNNIYPSHLLGFKSLIAIKKEKGDIFSRLFNQGEAVINADNHALSIWNSMLKGKKVWRFSLFNKVNIDFFSSEVIQYNNGVQFMLHTPYGKAPVFLSMFGLHNISNALAASALAFSVGANLSEIIFGLQNIQAIPGRLFPIILNKGKLLLLDDTYNSNVGSMISAIQVLKSMPGYRILVISDMLELGEYRTILYHRYIGRLIIKTNIDQVFTLGDISCVITEICKKGRHFQNKCQLISHLYQVLNRDQQISLLIKGSRVFCMEEIVYSIKDRFKCCYG